MAYLLGQLHFWTLKEAAFAIDSNIGCRSYHSKGSNTVAYNEEFKGYCEDQGKIWCPSKKRPDKLKVMLKDVEELLTSFRCIYCEWKTRNCLQIMLNTGVVVIIWMKAGFGDIERICIDRYLVGKLYSDHIVEAVFSQSSILISYVEPKLTIIQMNKKPMFSADQNKKWEKLSSADVKITTTDLIGPTGRRLERRLSCNVKNDQLMIWWMSSSNEVWPWTPVSTEKERANVHIFNMNGTVVNLLCYTRTKSDPIWASYSHLHLHQLHTIEQQMSRKEEITVDICIYEISKNKIQRTSTTTIPLGSAVMCHGMNWTEDRILLGCKDGSLVMYYAHRKTTRLTHASFIPSLISWHPSGSIVMVGSEKGEIQCFDMALCSLNLEILSEASNPILLLDLAIYFRFQPVLQKLIWNPHDYSLVDTSRFSDNSHTLLLFISQGPLAMLTFASGVYSKGSFSIMELITEYVKCAQMDEAINLLLNLNWNVESELCYKCLLLIMNSLLRLPLNTEREDQMELALGSYYSPAYLMSDVITLQYHIKIVHLARRFFHHLLRYEKFEKAFLLAADIGSKDLFTDIHYVAADKGERTLAQAALERAQKCNFPTDSSSRGSEEGSESWNGTSCSSYDSDFESNLEHQDHMAKSSHRNELCFSHRSNYQWPSEPSIKQKMQWDQLHRKNQHSSRLVDVDKMSTEDNSKINDPRFLKIDDVTEEISGNLVEEEDNDDEDGHGVVHVVHFG